VSNPGSQRIKGFIRWLIDTSIMTNLIASDALATLIQVVMIDLVLAGDNAVVIGLAAAGLPDKERKRAILIGIVTATVLRIVCATIAAQLLQVLGLLLAGGVLLLWVCWKMWRELHTTPGDHQAGDAQLEQNAVEPSGMPARSARRKTIGQATLRIVIADISMSLDNVLAIAGAAREHPFILAFGLLLSIALMGLAANLIASLLEKHRWIAYIGLAIILYVACEMIYRGTIELIGASGVHLQ
jgi:YjbE family integral membrane protein